MTAWIVVVTDDVKEQTRERSLDNSWQSRKFPRTPAMAGYRTYSDRGRDSYTSLSLEFLLLRMTRGMESETTASFVATKSQRNRK